MRLQRDMSKERKETRERMGMTLLFEWFIMDKTHCIFIFNHPFDELSFSQSLCKGKKGRRIDVIV